MSHTSARLAGIAAMLAALTFAAPPIVAAGAAGRASRPKVELYAKYCGSQGKHGRGDKCIKAMRKLATGQLSSPRTACAGVSRKRARGKPSSAFTRCVRAGSRLLKVRNRKKADAGDLAAEQAQESAGEGSGAEDGADPGDAEGDNSPSDKWVAGGADDELDASADPVDPSDDALDAP
jgi:hypothetical protein